MQFKHTSVMPQQVHEFQDLKPGSICVDCTLGGAGHAKQTLQAILPGGKLIGIDQDIDAIENARQLFGPDNPDILLCHSNYSKLPRILIDNQISGVDAILLDLGYSLHQMKNSRRGFSFNSNEPLDMRMDVRSDLTAYDLINSFKENELADIFFKFGEERFSRRIAGAIVKARKTAPLQTSRELAEIVTQSIPKKLQHKSRIHPATRVFQAVRIAVNRELERLEAFMREVPQMLNKGGRICVISFHSLEDRIVKQAIRKFEDGCTCPKTLPQCLCGFQQQMKSLTRKPVMADEKETAANPMARSAKLRVAQRV